MFDTRGQMEKFVRNALDKCSNDLLPEQLEVIMRFERENKRLSFNPLNAGRKHCLRIIP